MLRADHQPNVDFETLATNSDLPEFNYRPGSYNCIRKKQLNEQTNQDAEIPYYVHKLHVAIDVGNHPEYFEAAWKLLLDIFKEECVYEVKLINPETPKNKVQPGKEATVYFVDKKYSPELRDDEFLAAHISVIKKLDQRIQKLGLPISNPPQEDHSTENLGCSSKALFISPPERDSNDTYIRAGNRGEFANPYLEVQKKYIQALQNYKTKREAESNATSIPGRIYAFFRNRAVLNGKVKTESAQQLINYLQGNRNGTFSPLQLNALIQEDSKLGDLVRKIPSTLLPPQIVKAHKIAIQQLHKKINAYCRRGG
jgi:hypothetical protein